MPSSSLRALQCSGRDISDIENQITISIDVVIIRTALPSPNNVALYATLPPRMRKFGSSIS